MTYQWKFASLPKHNLNPSRDLSSCPPTPERALPNPERQKGLWSFLTWSFFLAQIVAATELKAGHVAPGAADSANDQIDELGNGSNAGVLAELARMIEQAEDIPQQLEPDKDVAANAQLNKLDFAALSQADSIAVEAAFAAAISGSTAQGGISYANTEASQEPCGCGSSELAPGTVELVPSVPDLSVIAELPLDVPLPSTPGGLIDLIIPPGIAIDLGLDIGSSLDLDLGADLGDLASLGLDVGLSEGLDVGLDLELGNVIDLELALNIGLPALLQPVTSEAFASLDHILSTVQVGELVDQLVVTTTDILGSTVENLADILPVGNVIAELNPIIQTAVSTVSDVATFADHTIENLTAPIVGIVSSENPVVSLVETLVADDSLLQPALAIVEQGLDLSGDLTSEIGSQAGMAVSGVLEFAEQTLTPVTQPDSMFNGPIYSSYNIALQDSLVEPLTSIVTGSDGLLSIVSDVSGIETSVNDDDVSDDDLGNISLAVIGSAGLDIKLPLLGGDLFG
jgi:hypothetical protein